MHRPPEKSKRHHDNNRIRKNEKKEEDLRRYETLKADEDSGACVVDWEGMKPPPANAALPSNSPPYMIFLDSHPRETLMGTPVASVGNNSKQRLKILENIHVLNNYIINYLMGNCDYSSRQINPIFPRWFWIFFPHFFCWKTYLYSNLNVVIFNLLKSFMYKIRTFEKYTCFIPE